MLSCLVGWVTGLLVCVKVYQVYKVFIHFFIFVSVYVRVSAGSHHIPPMFFGIPHSSSIFGFLVVLDVFMFCSWFWDIIENCR